jgi:hypothetical protein
MVTKFAKKPEMKADDAEAVIEDPRLPRMGEKPSRAGRAKGGKAMDVNAKPAKGGKDHMGAGRKAPAGTAKKSANKSGDAFPDQVAGKGPAAKSSARKPGAPGTAVAGASAKGRASESYLRMRVRVENGEMSVVDVHEVEGPLSMPDNLPSGFVYEVTLGQKRVAVGSVPDLGEWRSYPSPSGPPELRVHHVTSLPDAEFTMRIPREEVSLSALPKTEVALYQVKEPAGDRPISRGLALEAEFTNEIREVARLKGIMVNTLPKDVQKEIRRALK